MLINEEYVLWAKDCTHLSVVLCSGKEFLTGAKTRRCRL
jgi:hypothetical protein